MKVVSGQKRGNKVEIIKPTVNFHENADFFHIGLALSGIRGSDLEVKIQLSLLCPYCRLHLILSYLGIML